MTDVAPVEHVEVQEPEVAEAEEAPDHEGENHALRAMLAHLSPDMDIDAELDNVAFRRDGSPVYIGEIAGGGATGQAPSPAAPAKREPKSGRPTEGTRATGRAPAKNAAPSISKMTHEERAKHYKETTLPKLKAGRS